MLDARVSSTALQSGDISIKVLLADDSAIVRRGIRQLLAARREIEIVGESTNFAQTIQMKRALNPHVVLLDLHMPDEKNVSPQEVRSHLTRGSQVLAISLWTGEDSREFAESLGAAAFLDKMNLASTLIPTIMQLKHVRSAAA
jgi:two-component system, NarL family, response regulator NreC